MTERLSILMREEAGLTAVEYAIAGALVAATLVAAFQTLGANVETTIDLLGTFVLGTP